MDDFEEFGFLDYKNIADAWLDKFNASLFRLAEANQTLANNLVKVKPLFQQQNLKKGVPVLSQYLNAFAKSLEAEIGELATSREQAFDAMRKSLEIYNESFPDNTERLEEIENQLMELVVSANGALKSTSDLRSDIAGLPKWTGESIFAQRKAVKSSNDLIDELHRYIDTNGEMVEYIRKLKE